MPAPIVTPAEFAAAARAGRAGGVSVRFATTTAPQLDATGRTVRYVLSDPSVGRDGFTIAQDGWILGDYLANPVFLWGHDDLALPIGRMVDVGVVNGKLRGTVEYIDADLSPFADTVYRMVRSGYLNAVSTRWLPHTWKYSSDPSRPGGIDFTSQELLEVSQVCVPGLATALAEARRVGIDTAPIHEWASEVLDRAGEVMMPRAELEALRKAAKMPITLRRRPTPARPTARAAPAVPIRPMLVPPASRFRSLGEQLIAIARAERDGRVDDRLIRAPTGAGESDPTTGGFLVDTQWSQELAALAYAESEVAALCDRRETAFPLADVRLPGIDETSRADGSRWVARSPIGKRKPSPRRARCRGSGRSSSWRKS
jgi:hypothetical protein